MHHHLHVNVHVHILLCHCLLFCQTLAETLNSLLEGLNMREELFSLGYTSRLVASQLAALPQAKARRKVCPLVVDLFLV